MKKNEDNKEYTENLSLINEITIPALYQVVIHNDDFTPMEFVISVLESFFYMDRRQAAEKMLEAHMQGEAICGVFSKDVAETKIDQIKEQARLNEYPLNCSMEAA
jgi:ATP-dependent Clp protease adaptor protein ClpS